MKVLCVNNTGESLRKNEYNCLPKGEQGRFGATGYTLYNELEIGKEYRVMGIIIFQTYQGYLIDGFGLISACPCQLFEVIDDCLPLNWNFRVVEKEEDLYPYVQAIFGYDELCRDKESYNKLIVDMEEEAMRIYFRRKIELEKLEAYED